MEVIDRKTQDEMDSRDEGQSLGGIEIGSPETYFDRELSWLKFARRVLAQVADTRLPLLERVKFAGIMGMLHDEFFMKRIGGLKRRIRQGTHRLSMDGRTAFEQLETCRAEILDQMGLLAECMNRAVLPALRRKGVPILDYRDLTASQRDQLRSYFVDSVQPILTPLAVDAEHPFPFISNDALNLAVVLPPEDSTDQRQFIRIKVPANRPRWVPLADSSGFVPLEQVIKANLDLMLPTVPPGEIYLFRVTRAAEGDADRAEDLGDASMQSPGSIVRQVSAELKARRFAGVVRLQIETDMPREILAWLCEQLKITTDDVFVTHTFLGLDDLLSFDIPSREDLAVAKWAPVTHPRLRGLAADDYAAVFRQIDKGDILVHHPYDSFDTSVLRFIQSSAVDPSVLAIKLTIYRTSKGSPIVQALADASRRGKQVAVLVEITARFDEAPNIAWGQYLETEGVHVAYGVEKLKTHVKLALVVREENGRVKRYAHIGTGNYHTGTARIYEDLGVLTSHAEICDEVVAVFNQLTGAMPAPEYRHMLVAPTSMRDRFIELIRREAEHARNGRRSGIRAKMNQLQDPEIINELYRAGAAGVPIVLNVRGLCCLRPGVPGLSETIRVFGVLGRFLEHSRIYQFANNGEPEVFIGSADWMYRNLTNRVETIMPVLDPAVRDELDQILTIYERDNSSAWDLGPDGEYVCREPADGEPPRAAQQVLLERARSS